MLTSLIFYLLVTHYTKMMVQVLNMDFKSTMNEGLPASRWEESSHCMIKGDLVQEIWSRYWEICS